MQKVLSFVSGLALVAAIVAAPSLSLAQTVSSTSSSSLQAQLQLLASLTAQVQALQQQLVALQQQQNQAMAQLVGTLRQGSQGDQVTLLQTLLAASSTIYPEGLVTGVYGPATARAVQRFQKANGLDQVGNVGPKTLEKLNEWLRENPIWFQMSTTTAGSGSTTTTGFWQGGRGENDNDNGGRHGQPCAIVPPGHLIAPGWLRKHNGPVQIILPCQMLPPGIFDHGFHPPTSTPTSTVSLSIFGVMATTGTSTATVNWMTNMPANSQVLYGLASSYGSMTALDVSQVTSHSETITGLAPGTIYHFELVSVNAMNQAATSSDMTFTTNAIAVNPLSVSSVMATPGTSTASVSWATNLPANSQVSYGLTSAYGSMTTLDATLVASHTEMLTGLAPAATYHFQVKSVDAASDVAMSSDMTFMTNALPVSPAISDISASAASTTATVAWTTNVPANGQVFYSTSSPITFGGGALSVSTTTMDTSHSLMLTDLIASTTYFYGIQSTDGSSNTVTSTQQSFTTTAQ